ncbi:MAG: hypothetical protein IMY67_11610, partial [Bacteroidetes bacterium]|nr:hypothetical protein [Bacteroidota bacterium]
MEFNFSKSRHPLPVVVGMCGHGLAISRALHAEGLSVIGLSSNLGEPGARTNSANIHYYEDLTGKGLISALLDLRNKINSPVNPILLLSNDRMVRTLAEHGDQ